MSADVLEKLATFVRFSTVFNKRDWVFLILIQSRGDPFLDILSFGITDIMFHKSFF